MVRSHIVNALDSLSTSSGNMYKNGNPTMPLYRSRRPRHFYGSVQRGIGNVPGDEDNRACCECPVWIVHDLHNPTPNP